MLIGMHSGDAPSAKLVPSIKGTSSHAIVDTAKSGNKAIELTGFFDATKSGDEAKHYACIMNYPDYNRRIYYPEAIYFGLWQKQLHNCYASFHCVYISGVRFDLVLRTSGKLTLRYRVNNKYYEKTLVSQLDTNWHHLAWGMTKISSTQIVIEGFFDRQKKCEAVFDYAAPENGGAWLFAGYYHMWPVESITTPATMLLDNIRWGTTVADIMPRAPRITRF